MDGRIPDYRNRSPVQIITEDVHFDSVGYVYRALSWLDVAAREKNACALQYAALDTRQGIEELLFEAVVFSVGGKLDRKEYEKCVGNATKLHKVVHRLNPDFQKLTLFMQAVLSTTPDAPQIEEWDLKLLLEHWGRVSNYLHWAGEPGETFESTEWFENGVAHVERAALHIWEKKTRGYSGIMMPDGMQPEVRSLWDRFRNGEIDPEAVKRAVVLALPVLEGRMNKGSQPE